MSGPGRKTKLTPERHQRFIQVIRAGNFIETACEYVGIHPDTYYGWMERAKQGGPRNQIYVEFAKDVQNARASVEIEVVARIRLEGNKGNLKANIFFLERSFPERWGRRRLELTGKDGEPLHPAPPALNLAALDDHDLEQLEVLVARATPESPEST